MSAEQSQRIFVAGHQGMVGRAIVRKLQASGNNEIVTRTRAELDLGNQQAVDSFFASEKIDQVYLAAARVGGIHANNAFPAEFIYANLMIQNNVVHAAHMSGVQKLLFLGSSCIYPKLAEQPMSESALLTGTLEPTNEPYAIAKIAGIKLCQAYQRQYGRDYRSVMPTNLYGPFDNFHPENSHVIPGLIYKFDQAIKNGASEVMLWGTGEPMREFLHVDDMAAASVHVMNLSKAHYDECVGDAGTHINVGTGEDCKIRTLSEWIQQISGYEGNVKFDTSKPDGTPRKLLDVSLLHATGWQHEINLEDGLKSAWNWYQDNASNLRLV
ncbi:MAG: GDP-L-fucose synthase family protein [Granulosicoccus sp.]